MKSSLLSGVTSWRISGRLFISVSRVERILSKRPDREGLGVSFFLLIFSLFLEFLPKVRNIRNITKYYKILHLFPPPDRERVSPQILQGSPVCLQRLPVLDRTQIREGVPPQRLPDLRRGIPGEIESGYYYSLFSHISKIRNNPIQRSLCEGILHSSESRFPGGFLRCLESLPGGAIKGKCKECSCVTKLQYQGPLFSPVFGVFDSFPLFRFLTFAPKEEKSICVIQYLTANNLNNWRETWRILSFETI